MKVRESFPGHLFGCAIYRLLGTHTLKRNINQYMENFQGKHVYKTLLKRKSLISYMQVIPIGPRL